MKFVNSWLISLTDGKTNLTSGMKKIFVVLGKSLIVANAKTPRIVVTCDSSHHYLKISELQLILLK